MSYTASYTGSFSYTFTDIETVVRRFTADLVMIAQSSGAFSESVARNYAHDLQVLAAEGYIESVDITLFSGVFEIRATQYIVNTSAGELTTSRPGGVMWPRVPAPWLRIILTYTSTYDTAARTKLKNRLKISWVPTRADTTHSSLARSGGRDYASNGWGMHRKDYAA